MRLSFAISMSSTRAVSGRVLSRPTAQPGKPAFGIRVEAHDNDSDVVRASALIRKSDEFFRRPRGIGLRLESPGDFRLGDHARQAIRTEKQDIPRKQRVLLGVHFNL